MNRIEMDEALGIDLAEFTGTSCYHRCSPYFPNVLLTDGAKYIGDKLGCFWLFDLIGLLQKTPHIAKHPELQRLQFWHLLVAEDASAKLNCEWDKDELVYSHKIPFTDFPATPEPLCLYSQRLDLRVIGEKGIGWVIHLPSEY